MKTKLDKFKDLLYEEYFDEVGEYYYEKIDNDYLLKRVNKEFGEELTDEQKDIIVSHITWNMERAYKDGVKFAHKILLNDDF